MRDIRPIQHEGMNYATLMTLIYAHRNPGPDGDPEPDPPLEMTVDGHCRQRVAYRAQLAQRHQTNPVLLEKLFAQFPPKIDYCAPELQLQREILKLFITLNPNVLSIPLPALP